MGNGVPASPSPLSSPDHPCFLGPSSTSTKGFGLRKWKRIKRDSPKMDYDTAYDLKVLKRDFYMSANPVIASQSSDSQSSRPIPVPPDSAGSSNISVNNLHFDEFFMKDGHKFGLETGTGFVFSRISEENNYTSSRSCSTVNVPKSGCIIGGLNTELGKDVVENKKPSNVKGGRDRIETTKKHRGDAIKIDRESSHCSGESESGSNFSFLQPFGFPCTDEGIETRCSTNNGEESVDGAQQSDEQTKMDQSSGSLSDDFVDGLHLEDDTAKNGDTSPSSSNDIFTEIMLELQIAHNALENEKKKLVELTTWVVGRLKRVEVKKTQEESSSGTILEGELPHYTHCLERKVGEGGVKEGIEAEMEKEELFGNKITKHELSSTATILEEEPSRHTHCLERKVGECEGGGGVEEEMEGEMEELFGNKVEAEMKYVLLLGAIVDHHSEIKEVKNEGYVTKKGGKKTRLFRAVSYFFIQIILLAVLLFSKPLPPHPTTTTTTPTVLPT